MMDENPSLNEADAVHHRLMNKGTIQKVLPFECYDCSEAFLELEDLATHSLNHVCHSEEVCLKCKASITVFFQFKHPVRIHSCKKPDLCHLHPELYLHSQFLFSKLASFSVDFTTDTIGCDLPGCKATFEYSVDGLFNFLKHSNKYKHTTANYCRRCFLPEFNLTLRNVKTTSHYCSKSGKVLFVSKCIESSKKV